MDETDWTERDALLLAFAELAGYGIVTVAGAAGTAAQARWEILAALRERAPYALGSYVFWLAGDEHLFAARRPAAAVHQRGGRSTGRSRRR